MLVTLTNEKEKEVFRQLVADLATCDQCGHVQPVDDIPPVVQCLYTDFRYGYVEVVCPKCGNVHAVVPDYSAFPSCVSAFENPNNTVDPNTDPIQSKAGEGVGVRLREQLRGRKQEDEKNGEKEKYRNLL